MQEQQITVGGVRHVLPPPFFVLATQNPIEQEGTYPLPEAQLDRFMFQVMVDYPSESEELEIVMRTTAEIENKITATLGAEEIAQLASTVRKVPIAEHIARYALQLARRSRRQYDDAPDFVREYVQWGAGPRASQYLVLGAKARAVLQGRRHVEFEDIQAVAAPVLRHRIRTNFNADAEGITSDDVVKRLIESTPLDAAGNGDGKVPNVFRGAEAK
jgi:MoxR-like ATPase